MKPAALPSRIASDAPADAGVRARETAQSVLDAVPTAALIVEATAAGLICRAANTIYEEWAGFARHTAIGLRVDRMPIVSAEPVLAAIGTETGRVDWNGPIGQRFIVNVSAMPGLEGRWLLILRDLERDCASAPFDALTGLPERQAFATWTKAALAGPDVRHSDVAVLTLDLDRLTTVNESLGYPIGDALLRAVSERLRGAIGPVNQLARIGGDRFAVLASQLPGQTAAMALAAQITTALSPPFQIDDCEIYATAGIGIASSRGRACTAEELIRDSGLAMHRAKRLGAGRIEIYQPLSLDATRDRFLLESEIRRAHERNQLFLMYQPIIDLDTGVVSGFEALVRWRHPQRGVVPPNDFIPAAESSGAILQIGRWALVTACRQLAEWRGRLGAAAEQVVMSVNLSGIQLQRDDVIGAVRAALSNSGLPANRLKLELTESVIIENAERAGVLLHRLKALGVTIAMDDFGTGYSSLGALNSLPIDILKIDRSFVSGMAASRDSYKIVDAVLSLARSLGLSTVAEGVETHEEAQLLKGLGCQMGQGYLYARPLSVEQAEAYLLATA